MSSMERRMEILEVLCWHRSDTVENLANEFGVSKRTIKYDIEYLSLSYPVYTVQGNGGGIYITDGYHLGMKYFSERQTALLEKLTKEYLEINLSGAKELTVELKYDKNWTDYIGSKPSAEYRKITIEIPDGAVASLTVGTTNEDITVSGLSFAKDVSLTANGGDIVCDMLGVGEAVSLVSKNSGISGIIVGGMDDFSIACRIKKGECNLPESKEGGEKSFSADCNNGDINIKFIG